MNDGQKHHLENGLFTKLNRIHKLTKYAKTEAHDFLNDELSEQDMEIAESKFKSMIQQMEVLIEEIKTNYSVLKSNDNQHG